MSEYVTKEQFDKLVKLNLELVRMLRQARTSEDESHEHGLFDRMDKTILEDAENELQDLIIENLEVKETWEKGR